MIDLRSLRPNNLTSPQFSHLLWVLYWPAYGIAFGALEFLRPAADCFSVHCRVDDLIPFCEYFFIPYLFWFVFLVGMNVYLALWEPKSFRKFMHFVAFTYTLTLLIYVVWPTKQDLRPTEFVRDNFFTHLAQAFSIFLFKSLFSLPFRFLTFACGIIPAPITFRNIAITADSAKSLFISAALARPRIISREPVANCSAVPYAGCQSLFNLSIDAASY